MGIYRASKKGKQSTNNSKGNSKTSRTVEADTDVDSPGGASAPNNNAPAFSATTKVIIKCKPAQPNIPEYFLFIVYKAYRNFYYFQ